jgi:hypothetical protein
MHNKQNNFESNVSCSFLVIPNESFENFTMNLGQVCAVPYNMNFAVM